MEIGSTASPAQLTKRTGGARDDAGAFLAGVVSAALAVAIGELIAGILAGAPSLVIAIGTEIIALQPPGAKDLVVSLFGTNDKLAVNLLILVGGLFAGGLVGIGARRSWNVAVAAWLVAGAVTVWAAIQDPLITPTVAVLTVALALGISLYVLRKLLLIGAEPACGAARKRLGAASTGTVASQPSPGSGMPEAAQRPDRRRFLIMTGGVAVASIVAGAVGRSLLSGRASASLAAAENEAAGGSPLPT